LISQSQPAYRHNGNMESSVMMAFFCELFGELLKF